MALSLRSLSLKEMGAARGLDGRDGRGGRGGRDVVVVVCACANGLLLLEEEEDPVKARPFFLPTDGCGCGRGCGCGCGCDCGCGCGCGCLALKADEGIVLGRGREGLVGGGDSVAVAVVAVDLIGLCTTFVLLLLASTDATVGAAAAAVAGRGRFLILILCRVDLILLLVAVAVVGCGGGASVVVVVVVVGIPTSLRPVLEKAGRRCTCRGTCCLARKFGELKPSRSGESCRAGGTAAGSAGACPGPLTRAGVDVDRGRRWDVGDSDGTACLGRACAAATGAAGTSSSRKTCSGLGVGRIPCPELSRTVAKDPGEKVVPKTEEEVGAGGAGGGGAEETATAGAGRRKELTWPLAGAAAAGAAADGGPGRKSNSWKGEETPVDEDEADEIGWKDCRKGAGAAAGGGGGGGAAAGWRAEPPKVWKLLNPPGCGNGSEDENGDVGAAAVADAVAAVGVVGLPRVKLVCSL